MAKTNSGLVEYASAQIGKPYWFGTYGQTATASLLASQKKQYPSYYTDSDFESQIGKRVHDCSGLIKGYLWSSSATATPTYKTSQDKSASGMYAAATTKGKIGTFPKTKGLLVFRGNTAAKISHVGVYDGNGYVIEAKGHAYGVVKTAYKSSDWNFWAQHPDITDDTASSTSSTSSKIAATRSAKPETIWNYLISKIGNAYGVAGLMGNLYAESGLLSINLQNTANTKLGMTDEEYTAAVDDGSYSNFESDSAGYGLAQWTYSSRKKTLKEYADKKNASIGNLDMQLEFLLKELSESFPSVLGTLCTATTLLESSNAVLLYYEQPANTGSTVQSQRAAYAKKYYDAYAGSSTPSYTVGKTYTLAVELKVRTGAGTSYTAKTHSQLTSDGQKHDTDGDGALDKGTTVTCKAVKTVGSDIWIQCPSGWIAAYYNGEVYIPGD